MLIMKLSWMEQILGSTSRILKMAHLAFLRLYFILLLYSLVMMNFFNFVCSPLFGVCNSLLSLKISREQLEAVVKELYTRNQKKWPLVVLHNKRYWKLWENPSNRELLEAWVAQGVLYTTPYGSNDDWYGHQTQTHLQKPPFFPPCPSKTKTKLKPHSFFLGLDSIFLLQYHALDLSSAGNIGGLNFSRVMCITF